MLRSFNSTLTSLPLPDKLGTIRKKLARAMVGSTVDLLADSHTIAHGTVAGIAIVAGTPKIRVNGQLYDMDQVLTATSPSFAC
jgi:hypothetical protein